MTPLNLITAPTEEAFNTTLDGVIDDDDASIALTSVTGLQYPGVIVVDRQSTAGADTPSEREYIYYTGISTNTLTGCERGLGGSTAQSHSDGALVEAVFTGSLQWEGLRTSYAAGHTDAGTGVHLTGTASIANIQAQGILVSTASIGALTSGTFNAQKVFASTASVGALNINGAVGGLFLSDKVYQYKSTAIPSCATTTPLSYDTGTETTITIPTGQTYRTFVTIDTQAKVDTAGKRGDIVIMKSDDNWSTESTLDSPYQRGEVMSASYVPVSITDFKNLTAGTWEFRLGLAIVDTGYYINATNAINFTVFAYRVA